MVHFCSASNVQGNVDAVRDQYVIQTVHVSVLHPQQPPCAKDAAEAYAHNLAVVVD